VKRTFAGIPLDRDAMITGMSPSTSARTSKSLDEVLSVARARKSPGPRRLVPSRESQGRLREGYAFRREGGVEEP